MQIFVRLWGTGQPKHYLPYIAKGSVIGLVGKSTRGEEGR